MLFDRYVPTVAQVHRHRGKIAGVAAGLLGPLLLVGLFLVLYTGHGLSQTPTSPPPIYPNF